MKPIRHIELSGTRYEIGGVLQRDLQTEILAASANKRGIPRKVLIKRLRPHLQGDLTLRSHLMDEINAWRQYKCAQVVRILGWTHQKPGPLLAMSYLDGASLAQLMAYGDGGRALFSSELALYITMRVAMALSMMHASADRHGRGLRALRGDLGLSNILVSWTGEICPADSGLALAYDKANGADASRPNKAGPDLPSAHQGPPSPKVGRGGKASVRSLGHILEAMVNTMHDHGAPLVPDDIRPIIRRACRSSLQDRYQNADEVLEACWRALVKRTHQSPYPALKRWLFAVQAHRAASWTHQAAPQPLPGVYRNA